jgi:4'-phosphopantetheinyl transferase
MLRFLLSGYLGIRPEELAFERIPNGKPSIHPSICRRGIDFSLSHSGNMVLLGFRRDTGIGVDVECVRPLSGLKDLAARILTEGERGTLFGLPESQVLRGFYTLWTRKEALVKGMGIGLSRPLHQLNTSPSLSHTDTSMYRDGVSGLPGLWRCISFQSHKSYASAFAVEGASNNTQILDTCRLEGIRRL